MFSLIPKAKKTCQGILPITINYPIEFDIKIYAKKGEQVYVKQMFLILI